MEILVEKRNTEPWMHAYSSSKTHTEKKSQRSNCFQKIVRNENFGGKEKYTAMDVCRF